MRGVFVAAAIGLAAAGCSGIEPGAVHPPDALADGPEVAGEPGTDPGGPDAYAGDGPRLDAPPGDEAANPDDGFIETDAPQDVETADNPDAEVDPGTIRHFGWFGPGAAGAGGGFSAFGSVCGPRQAWKVQ